MKRIVNQKEMLVKSLETLFFSWGSDTPDLKEMNKHLIQIMMMLQKQLETHNFLFN